MTKVYVIAEVQSDINILKPLLPPDVAKDVDFVAAGGIYAAQTLASTILTVKQMPLALIIDADTTSESDAQERLDFAKGLLSQASIGVPFEVFVAIPTLETALLQNNARSGKALDRDEIEALRNHPLVVKLIEFLSSVAVGQP